MDEHGPSDTRNSLAVLGGFLKPEPRTPSGGPKAAYLASHSVARLDRYDSIHSFHDARVFAQGASFDVPVGARVKFHEKRALVSSAGAFSAILSLETEWENGIPHALRPFNDWPPVVCEVGTSHSQPQWLYLFWALKSGFLRPSDALVFKADTTRRLFSAVLDDWTERFGPLPRCTQYVINQGVRCDVLRPNEQLRTAVRSMLGINGEKTLFLAFSRLSPGTKGDQLALLALWREVISECPHAVLVCAGATVDRRFTEDLQRMTRELNLGTSTIVLPNPHELWSDPGQALMTAADVLIHPSTGVEEVASLVVCEAMAYGLPIIAADWSGMRELVRNDENGFLIPTLAVAVPHELRLSNSMGIDPSYNVELARCSAMDAVMARAAIVSIARSREMRARLGEGARRHAERVLNVEVVGVERLKILEESSQLARSSWLGSESLAVRPLVDVNIVVSKLASANIDRECYVSLAEPENVRFMPEFRFPHTRTLLSLLIEGAGSQRIIRISDLIEGTKNRFSEAPRHEDTSLWIDEHTKASFQRLCMRLMAFNVLSVVNRDDT